MRAWANWTVSPFFASENQIEKKKKFTHTFKTNDNFISLIFRMCIYWQFKIELNFLLKIESWVFFSCCWTALTKTGEWICENTYYSDTGELGSEGISSGSWKIISQNTTPETTTAQQQTKIFLIRWDGINMSTSIEIQITFKHIFSKKMSIMMRTFNSKILSLTFVLDQIMSVCTFHQNKSGFFFQRVNTHICKNQWKNLHNSLFKFRRGRRSNLFTDFLAQNV